MDEIKYVVVLGCGGIETIILFPAWLRHNSFKPSFDVVAAGFVGRTSDTKCGFYCHGASDSLGLKCRPELDQRLLDGLMRDPWA